MRYLSDILAKAGLVVDGVVTLNNVANATIDTDKFLVIDSGVVKYRSGTQMLSDIGAAAVAAGTTNYVTKWTSANALGNSQIFDNGTNIGIGEETSPTYKTEIAVTNAGGIATPLQVKNYANPNINPGQGVQIAFANERGATSTNGFVQGLIRSQITNVNNGASALSFHNWSGTAIEERMRLTSAGNLGIRTNNPTVGLVVNSSAQILGNDAPASGVGLELYSNGTKAGTIAYNRTSNVYIPQTFDGSQLEFLAGGVERLRIFANGRVGVNTTADNGYQLDVNGSIRGLQLYTGSLAESGGFLRYNYASGNANSRSWRLANDVVAYGDFAIGQSTTQTGSTFDNTRLYISNGGNVGIGTTSPQTTLDVRGKLQVSDGGGLAFAGTSALNLFKAANPRISFYDDVDHEASIGVVTVGGTTYGSLTFNVGASTPERMRITSGGNVGIGTNSPGYRLDVRTASVNDIALLLTTVGGGANLVFSDGNTVTAPKIGGFGDQLIFTTNNTIQARINTSGNLLVGTTNNLARLTVQNSASADVAHFSTVTSGAYVVFADGNTTVASRIGAVTNSIVFNTASTGTAVERMRITADGNVGVGTTTPAASARLDVTSTTQGFLPPRMTATQRAAITSPAVGLVVYQTDGNEGLWIYTNANGWKSLAIVV